LQIFQAFTPFSFAEGLGMRPSLRETRNYQSILTMLRHW